MDCRKTLKKIAVIAVILAVAFIGLTLFRNHIDIVRRAYLYFELSHLPTIDTVYGWIRDNPLPSLVYQGLATIGAGIATKFAFNFKRQGEEIASDAGDQLARADDTLSTYWNQLTDFKNKLADSENAKEELKQHYEGLINTVVGEKNALTDSLTSVKTTLTSKLTEANEKINSLINQVKTGEEAVLLKGNEIGELKNTFIKEKSELVNNFNAEMSGINRQLRTALADLKVAENLNLTKYSDLRDKLAGSFTTLKTELSGKLTLLKNELTQLETDFTERSSEIPGEEAVKIMEYKEELNIEINSVEQNLAQMENQLSSLGQLALETMHICPACGSTTPHEIAVGGT